MLSAPKASRVGALAVTGSRQLVSGRVQARHGLPGRGLHPPGGHDLAPLVEWSVLHVVFLDKVCIHQVDEAQSVLSRSRRADHRQGGERSLHAGQSAQGSGAELVNNLGTIAESGTILWRS